MPKKNFNASVLPSMRAFTAKLIGRKDCVLVGLSGGADSVALLRVLTRLAPRYDWTVRAAHFNHGIRGVGAEEDELFCRNLCEEMGVPFYSETADVPADVIAASEGAETAQAFLDTLDGAQLLLYNSSGEARIEGPANARELRAALAAKAA